VGVGVGVGSGEGDGLGVGLSVGVGPEGVGDGVAAGAAALIVTPLLQTNFLPFLIQVYSLPAFLLSCPAFLHVAPALTAALEIKGLTPRVKTATNEMARARFIGPKANKEGLI
jgi:hypothetical protein